MSVTSAMTVLHVTNGESAAGLLRESGIGGDVLAWNDVLHEGPVPAGLSADALRLVRAEYLASEGWTTVEAALGELEARDRALEESRSRLEVCLWFEHDLYDQLQLLQILDRYAAGPRPERLSAVVIGEHPEVDRFIGLGQLEPHDLAPLWAARQAVTDDQLQLGVRAWRAFRQGPEDWRALDRGEHGSLDPLRFLGAAISRLVAELPSGPEGLGRTERLAIEELRAGADRLGSLFRAVQEREEAPFLGDSVFFSRMRRLASGSPALIVIEGEPVAGARVRLTSAGVRLLEM